MSVAHENARRIISDILGKQNIERVWFVGCGGSLTGFWPWKYFLDCEASKLAVGYITSNEFVHATPKALGKIASLFLPRSRAIRRKPSQLPAWRVKRSGDHRSGLPT